ncbi:anaphase-promoting complex subunit 4 WD40 domain-containing protein [Hirsutella rhossiliensis]|uniref:Anaphase-promoting complex subunit 4 WD40 domain-containing protein n=1 Tax=Hirsutella rhossiliensis TaxID=111463 RepID=A0A9P8MNR6_9HYPO|nr:anaphase-promoting complex subunit 4 WD40 domain-containing protein [Hirsutella rhossiliensis]KAH0958342.1 anaphase-promoting complex subunit 4 WD40 domain-containing protein [Hirsutella rhossiliensis]
MATPSIQNCRILAAAPTTARGQPTQLSADSKGQRIAYASGKSIFVRSIDNPADCKEYTGHNAPTTVARFAPNGLKVASGDASGVLRVWEPESIESTRGEYAIISGRLNDIAWDGESQRVIAVGDGKEHFGRCITADSGNSVGEIIGHSKAVNAVAMKAQRPFRAATVGDDGNMVFYHGAPYKFNDKSTLHRGFVLGAAYSPDGNTLVTVGADKRIELYDGKTGQPTAQVGEGEHTGSIFSVSWSHDGRSFATASADQTVKLWDAEARTLIQTWKFGDGVSVRDQQVGVVVPHGRSDGLIISVNLDGELTYLTQGKPEPVRIVKGHDKGITAMTASSDGQGRVVWTGSFDGRVCCWDVDSGLATVVDGEPHKNQVAQLTAQSGKVYSASWDDTVKVADESAKTFLGQAVKLSSQPKGASALDGILYVTTVSGVAAYADGKLLKETAFGSAPEAIATSGSFVAVGADQNSVRIYRADSSGNLDQVKSIPNPTGAISALAFSKDGSHLAAGNGAGKIYVYNTGTWDLVADRWSAHTARVTCISWDDSGAYAASGSLDTNVFVWCLEKKNQGKRIKAANAHKDGVSGICWVQGGRLASAGVDATVKIWEARNLP